MSNTKLVVEAHLCNLSAAEKREHPGKCYALQTAVTDALGRREWIVGGYVFVANKREARAVCKAKGYTPWNF